MLYVKAERRSGENTSDIKTSDDAMEPCKTLAQTIRKLHRTEQKHACTGQTVRQKPPLESW